ncbi:MAG TPA: NAD(P)/FAD-dependent oxidoreductase [Ilumatobacteraceae bacterium]|nr:NAD(P)/FAD-dependent oxidoreductase [Ilumatobacteraceae bacterium]
MSVTPSSRPAPDYDAIVIGAGHNGLVTAAYLSRAGMRTLLIEARADVGGTAASEGFAGATVNICNCDHLTFRTTPVIEELGLTGFGLEYLDVEPAQHNFSWDSAARGHGWSHHHDLEATLDDLGRHFPDQVDGYRRYAEAAMPAIRMVFEAAAEPPTVTGLTRMALRRRLRGAPTLMRWSRRSAADVLRSYFTDDAVTGPGALIGPMVWGISPETPGTGLGALPHAMRHVGRLGRPVGGSGQVPLAILAAFEAAGGTLRTKSPVDTITCEADRVSGVALVDGTEITAPVVVSACNPHDTFLKWLRHPPSSASDLVRRWSNARHDEGYESKIDAVLSAPPVLRGFDRPLGPTTAIAPGLAEIHRGAGLIAQGRVMDRPGMLVNVPTALDPSMAPEGRHVFSLEAIYTPFGLRGGWPDSDEPRRWLEAFAALCEPGFLDSIIEWRAMTPDVYERDFHLPAGHATSFAGGPLAAFRNADPELTKYETAVDGLYLTGAATFPGAGVWGASGRNCATVILEQRS